MQTDHYQNYAQLEYPDFVVIDTTYHCNVICGMCHLASKTFQVPANPHISIELVERTIPLLKKCRSVFLLGRGEPLMHPRIYDIVGLIKGECPDIYMSFVSNGLLLTRRNIGKLLDLKLDRIHISIDGPDLERGHPQFEKVKANVRELALQKSARGAEYPVIHINYVIGMDNVLAVVPTLEFGLEVGIEGMTIEPLRILEPMPEWDDYIKANSIYSHLDTVVPLIDKARVLAVKHGIEITTSIPTNLKLFKNRRKRTNHKDAPVRKEIKLPVGTLGGLKCDRPFKMLRVEMNGSVYMCPGAQNTNLNAFEVNPVEIWNSTRFREVRCRLDTEEYDSTCLDCHILKNRLTFEAENERKRLQPDKFNLTEEGLADSSGVVLPINDYMHGYIEDIKTGNGQFTLMGWVADFKVDRPCMFIVVFVGGFNCAVVRPTMRRPDVANHFSKPLIEVCGFMVSFDYPEGLLVQDRTLHVWAIDKFGSGREITNISDKFTLTEERLADSSGVALPVNDYVHGYIEEIRLDHGRLTLMGWAVDSKADRPCMFVVVFVGGVNYAVVRPTMRRSDVASHFSNALIEVCGFMVSFKYPESLLVQDPTLRVWAIDEFGGGGEIASVPITLDAFPPVPSQ